MPCKEKGRGTAEGEICCYEGAQDFLSHTNSIRVLTLPISAFITVVSKRNGTLPVRTLHSTKGSAITVQSVVIEKLSAATLPIDKLPKPQESYSAPIEFSVQQQQTFSLKFVLISSPNEIFPNRRDASHGGY